MSWAEIKKAVNSDLSEPLNDKVDNAKSALADMFGLEYVRSYYVSGDDAGNIITISGFTGVIFAYANSQYGNVTVGTSSTSYNAYGVLSSSGASAHTGILPLAKNKTYALAGIGVIDLFVWGGGIS